jgi:hypothetical protein
MSKERNCFIFFICLVNLRVCEFQLRKPAELCAPMPRQRAPVLSSLPTSPATTAKRTMDAPPPSSYQ